MKLMSDNISSIAKALVSAQKEMGNALKDAKNPFFKSKYADLNAVREAVLPACNSNGISVLQPTISLEGRKYVQTMLVHESGEYISGLTEILSTKEFDAQAQGSGISYARRYGLQSLANVGAEDDDGESAVGRSAAPIRSNPIETSQASPVSTPVKLEVKEAAPVIETPGKKSFRKPAPTTNSEEL